MKTWEQFSAFGDLAELEHVCEILSLNASEANEDLEYITGESSALIRQLNQQAMYSERFLEQERPGLYQRTWMASLFWRLFVTLDEVTEKPYRLAEEIDRIQVDLHKVLIAAHEVFDPHHRAELLKKANADGLQKGHEEANKAERQQKSEAATVSHKGRKEQQEVANSIFLESESTWDSIAAAVEVIKPKVLEMKASVSRPISESNADRTIRGWISSLLKSCPQAKNKLTPSAQARLKK